MGMSNVVRTVAVTGSDQVVSASPCAFSGYSLRNSHLSTACVVQIYDNASAASGTLLATINLTSNNAVGASTDVTYAFSVWAVNGIFVHPVGGTLEGSIRIQ